ncbi:mutS protein homolog 4-like [Lycorma delicatula]|uniref:mutS protein homolog 4-like n=1 Tax=Lycorma delicatula TaxID=130591 RepID=UPI003F51A501
MKQSTTNSKIVKKNNQLSGSVSISNGDNQFNDNKLPNNVVNSAGPADLVNRILQTPTGNHHFILPLLTNSIKRGTNLNTPVLVNKQIQSLLPLNSFSDSGKRNNRSDSSSGPHPHTTPSDKLRTPRSTSGSHDSNHNVILAITEGRGLARGEIGIAVMDIKRPQLILCQISDAQTYTNTLAKINFFNPVEILIPNTFVEKPQSVPLFDLINDCFPDVSLTTVQRRHYNDKVGLSQIQNLCLPEYLSIDLIIKHKFYALAAAAALIKYIEFSQTVLFSKRSIKVEYQGAEDIMTIDMESAKQLELVLCNSGGGYEQSLLGILNHCSTVSGRRCLRANILQPPYNHQVTEMRLNCVTELVEDPNLLASLKRELVKFEDVEQLLWLCLQLPNLNVTDKPNEVQMNFILLLKATLVALPNLVDCLKDAKVSYFHDCLVVLRDSRYSNILEIVHKSINEDARVVKGFMASQHQRCFAIKPEVNGLLDVARSTYSNLIEETRNKVIELSKEYNLPLKLSSSNSKGMHIQLSLMQNRSFSVKDLPPLFIQVNRVSKNLITCTTEDILILNQRMKHALREIQLMSNVIVGEILHKVREHIGCLYKLCEIIAELDILLSFALVSSSTDFVRPTFGHKMKLIASRHPILDVINRSRPVGNNVIASKEKNFHIITGPNMGGKSIYIRQVALLQIMAQIGCYVPAESAQFCSIHSLFTRIGFDDSIEHNASTFRLEMWQMKYILQSAAGDHCSLILVDELCRGTCSEEGTAIAWALCQELAALNAFTFFTTHFNFLTQLEYVHSNITNWHFEVEECEHGRLIYTHKLLSGANKVSSYGIQLAKQTSLPNSVLKFILEFYNELSSMKQAVTSNLDSEIESNQQFIDILSNKIIDLIDNGKSSEEIIYVLEELSTSKNHVASFNSQDSINYREQDAECNDDNNNDNGSSYNLHERMYNVEVQLEELDVVINNIDDDDNNSDSIKDNNEPFTTQDCVDMLEDSTVQIGNSEMVVDETVDRLNLTETVKEGNLHVD